MRLDAIDGIMMKVDEIAKTYDSDPGHNEQVTGLALSLFDDLVPLHRYGSRERHLLQIAGRMHDIGWSKTVLKQHHKLSGDMILKADIPGLAGQEKLVCSLIARYHTKALPDRSKHRKFASLSARNQEVVEWLAGMLRVADALDSSHNNVVRGVRLKVDNGECLVKIDAAGDSWAEIRRVHRKDDLLAKKTGRQIVYQC